MPNFKLRARITLHSLSHILINIELDLIAMIDPLFQTAFQTARLGMAFVHLNGGWMRTNPALCSLFGYSQAEMGALTFQMMTPSGDLIDERIAAHQLFSGEIDSYQGEQRFYRKDGHVIFARLNACLVRDSDGRADCFFLQVEDITPSKEIENVRKALLMPPTALHFVAGFDGYFKKLGNAWTESLGYSMEYLLSIPYLELVHPDDRDKTVKESQLVAESSNTFLFENRYRHANGSYRWLLWSTVSEPREGLVHGVALDYTARKQAEEEFEQTLRNSMRLHVDLGGYQQEVARLREGLLTVCAWTKRIRFEGQWMSVDEFLIKHLHLNLTHGISDEAAESLAAETTLRAEV